MLNFKVEISIAIQSEVTSNWDQDQTKHEKYNR